MRGSAVALLLLMLASGCVAIDEDPPAPAAALLEYASFTSHFHNDVRTHESRLMPATNGTGQPVRCVAFRDNQSHAGDTCGVGGQEPAAWYAGHHRAWRIEVAYRIHMNDTQQFVRNVQAFDGDGRHVAQWNGERHPQVQYVTE